MRWKRLLLVAVVLAVAGLAGGALWLATSESAVRWVAARAVAASGGALAIDAPSGALGGTVRARRVRYSDDDLVVTATDVAFEWSPGALLAGRVRLATLAAREVEIAPKPARGPTTPPGAIGLPLALTIERARIARLVWREADTTHAAEAVAFGYRGSPSEHSVNDLAARTAVGALRGSLRLAAHRPFRVDGGFELDPAPRLRVEALRARLGGTLERLEVALDAALPGARATGELRLAPFAERWLEAGRLRAGEIDLARLDSSLPRTRLSVTLTAASGGADRIDGELSARNGAAGPITDDRLPVAGFASPFRFEAGRIALGALRVDLGAAGAAAGTAMLAAQRVDLALAVRDLDLRAIHRPLRATRLAGRLDATLGAAEQAVRARLAERGIELELDGARRGDTFVVQRARVAAGAGAATAAGTIGLTGERAFSISAVLDRLDPAAFGEFPDARLAGRIAAVGALEPRWRADLKVELADSRWRKAPVTGHGELSLDADAIRDARASLRIGANAIAAEGGLGRATDALVLRIDAARLAELDPRIAGALTGTATLRGALARPGVELALAGERLAVGGYRARTVEARGAVSADADPQLALEVRADVVAAPRIAVGAASVQVKGHLARHVIDVRARGDDVDLAARLAGGWRERAWRGALETLANRGRFALTLTAPAALELARERAVVGATAARLGDGEISLKNLHWERGRLASTGRFSGVALAPFLALLPERREIATTLVLAGSWSIDLSPRLNGTVSLARESGDVALGEAPAFPLGLTRLALEARVVDDAVAARLDVATVSLGAAQATLKIDRVPGAEPGVIPPAAPIRFAAHGSIASLRPLGTLARGDFLFDGSVRGTLAAAGTLAAPRLTAGRAEARGLAIELPTYGVRLANGHGTVTLTDEALVLEAFEIDGGEGRFTARGTAPRDPARGGTTIAWRAERFRLFGRPDLRLTVDGDGVATFAGGRLALEGRLAAREGYVEFARRRGATLDDDVIVVGRPAKPQPAARQDVPLRLALDLDFGREFHILGAGLDAWLQGALRIATADRLLTAKGAVRTARGTYFFLGQRLEIERGRLIFDGPVDDPALDIRAVRRGLAVEAGVELTGSVRTPSVRLVSNPPLPESEALAWLVLGRSLSTATATDAVLLSAGAAALLEDPNSIPLGRRVALAMGLDDIRLQGGSQLQGQVVAVGKQLSERVYLTFEQGLAAAQSIVGLEFLLGRGFRVRAASGTDNSVGIFYSRSWD